MTAQDMAAAIRTALAPILEDGHTRVFLFGSRADGSARGTSDWDIGVDAGRPLPKDRMGRAREACDDLPTLHGFDLVDFAEADARFRAVAGGRIVRLFGPESP